MDEYSQWKQDLQFAIEEQEILKNCFKLNPTSSNKFKMEENMEYIKALKNQACSGFDF